MVANTKKTKKNKRLIKIYLANLTLTCKMCHLCYKKLGMLGPYHWLLLTIFDSVWNAVNK